MAVRDVSPLSTMIAEARDMQKTGQYINGTVFHAMADRIDELEAVLAELVTGHSHTRIFLTSREKMHPTGVDLWDEAIAKAIVTLSGKSQHHTSEPK